MKILIAALTLVTTAFSGYGTALAQSPNPNDWFLLTNKNLETSDCLESGNLNGKSGMENCVGASGQKWKFVPAGGEYFLLKSQFRGDNECLEGSTRAAGARMVICQNATGQRWKIVSAGEGYYAFQSQLGGEDLCLEGGSRSGQAKLLECNSIGQAWKIISASSMQVFSGSGSSSQATVVPNQPQSTSQQGAEFHALTNIFESGKAQYCTPEGPSWTYCIETIEGPKITVHASKPVTTIAVFGTVNIYLDMLSRLKPHYDAKMFDGFKVYITNGETHDQLKNLATINQMWTDGYGPKSRAFLRGGANSNMLWVSEQMICKAGVKTRNDDLLAGRVSRGDDAYRSFDQVVHEFAHSIDQKYGIGSTYFGQAYPGDASAVETFAGDVQNWFGVRTPSLEYTPVRKALMDQVFRSSVKYVCKE